MGVLVMKVSAVKMREGKGWGKVGEEGGGVLWFWVISGEGERG